MHSLSTTIKKQNSLPFFSGGLEWNRLWRQNLVERSCLRTAAADNRSKASFPAGASPENPLPCSLHLERWMALFQYSNSRNHQNVIAIFLLNTTTKQGGKQFFKIVSGLMNLSTGFITLFYGFITTSCFVIF